MTHWDPLLSSFLRFSLPVFFVAAKDCFMVRLRWHALPCICHLSSESLDELLFIKRFIYMKFLSKKVH